MYVASELGSETVSTMPRGECASKTRRHRRTTRYARTRFHALLSGKAHEPFLKAHFFSDDIMYVPPRTNTCMKTHKECVYFLSVAPSSPRVIALCAAWDEDDFINSRMHIVAYDEVGSAKLRRRARNFPSLSSTATFGASSSGATRHISVSVKSAFGSEYRTKEKLTWSGLTSSRLYVPERNRKSILSQSAQSQ